VELFLGVAEAVEYAHAHMVLHRDLKPGNILITGEGQPKLLDFGIARMLSEEVEGSAESTVTGGLRSFTPEYASPEQMQGGRVTTASDVYSLGVILYVLLAGSKPYELAGLTPPEALKRVCERDPQRPSSVAVAAWRRVLAGDLDNIVLKSLRKEPGDRYPSVRALSDDLRAWREGRPVSASAHTLRYQAGKLLRRYRVQVAAAGLVLLALACGVVATGWQAHVAGQERDRAQNRFRQVREFSRSLLFEVHESLRKLPGATAPRLLLLGRAVQFLDDLANDAKDDKALALELAEGYRRLGHVQGSAFSANVGDRKGAIRSFEKAAALGEEVMRREPQSLDAQILVMGAYNDLSLAWWKEGDSDRADAAFRRHQALVEAMKRDHAGGRRARISVATSYSQLAAVLGARNDVAAAKALYHKAIEDFGALAAEEPLPPPARSQYAFALKRLGGILIEEGSLEQAERRYRRALELEEEAIRRDPGNSSLLFDMSFTLSDLALIATRRGDYASAETLSRRLVEIRANALAADPVDQRALAGLANAHGRLAAVLRRQKRFSETEAEYRESLRLRQEMLRRAGPEPEPLILLADAQAVLAECLLDQVEAGGPRRGQRLDEALRLLRQAHAVAAVKANAAAAPPTPPFVVRELQRAERLAGRNAPPR